MPDLVPAGRGAARRLIAGAAHGRTVSLAAVTGDAAPRAVSRTDPRDLKAGWMVSDRNGYYDSQNLVETRDERGRSVLSVILHHSENREGGPGLRLYGTRSYDRGRTWTPLEAVEDPARQSHHGRQLREPGGARQSHDGYQVVRRDAQGRERIWLFYGWNVGSQYPPGAPADLTEMKRTDMQLHEGYWVRASDDGGATWGPRALVPVRRTRIDRENPWGGATMGMFCCDAPQVIDGAVYMAFQKTRDGAGETPGSEAFVLRSRDLFAVHDPADATWETLPHGDEGLRAPAGELALGEEPHVLCVGVPDERRLLCLWRTEVGRLAASYSSDGGETWDAPGWLTHEGPLDGATPLRNPRGAITPYRLRAPGPDGLARYLLLYYNNGRTERLGYVGRRVAWLVPGRATRAGTIEWGQPEIALWWDGTGFEDRPDWNPDWAIVDGPGYADFCELGDGTLAMVESNKLAVRYHEVEPRLRWHLVRQWELAGTTREGLAWRWTVDGGVEGGAQGALESNGIPFAAPVLPDLRAGGGATILLRVAGRLAEVAGRPLVAAWSTVTAALGEEPTDRRITKGWEVSVCDDGELALRVSDGFGLECTHATTIAAVSGVWDGRAHLVAFVLDGGPKVVSVVVDERLDDGGAVAPQGWARFDARLGEVGGAELLVDPRGTGAVREVALYDRALLTTEAVAASRSTAGGR